MIDVRLLVLSDDATVPAYAREGDAGADLVAHSGVTLAPKGGRALVPTGICIEIPEGHAGFVLPRSGLAVNYGVTCLNTPGLIDSGYRGEIKVLLVNTDSTTAYEVKKGDRVAQLVVVPVASANFIVSEKLSPSERSEGGFGHSGR